MFKQYSNSKLWLSRKLITATIACLVFGVAATAVNAQFKGMIRVQKTTPLSVDALANEAVDLDTCENGGVGQPTIRCQTGAWANGNLTASKSHYVEHQSVPYRALFTGLAANTSYTVVLGYDTTKAGKHATDFLTAYNRTELDADFCSDSPALCAAISTFAIPHDPNVPAAYENAANTPPRQFALVGGTITAVSVPTICNGSYASDSETCISVTFTTNNSGLNAAALAWGGHIARRLDWGINNSAVAINGSPYHMHLEGLFSGDTNLHVGSQDHQLSADAVFFPAGLQIIKEVNIVGGASTQSFGFTTSANFGVAGNAFSLVDNNVTGPDRISVSYADVAPGTITVTESANPTNWNLTALVCSIDAGGGSTTGTAVGVVGTRTATINLAEANIAVCTYTNTFVGPTAAQAGLSGRVATKAGVGIRGALVTILDATTGETKYAVTNTFGYYNFTELQVEDFYVLNVSAKRYTFSENFQQSLVMHEDAAGINFTSDQ
jgi:hypothetical protein